MFPFKYFNITFVSMAKITFSDDREITLIQQVSEVYLKKGIKAITMDDMAKELHVSKKTLYKYVENKIELVQKAVQIYVLDEQKSVEEIQSRDLNPIQETQEIVTFVIQTLAKVNPLVHYDLQKYFPKAWNTINNYFNGFVYESILLNLNKGQEIGIYRTDFSAEIVAKIFITKLDLVFDAELFPPSKFTFVQVYLDFIQHHLHGIVSEKGRTILNKINFTNI